MKSTQNLAGIILLIAVAVLMAALFSEARSSDLLATWIAGQFYANGQLGEIYLSQSPIFTMRPHESWISFMAENQGYDDAVFPFIYPPIWVWLAAQLSEIPFETVEKVATTLNAFLICGTIFLAHRTLRGSLGLPLFAAAVLILLFSTSIGTMAMFENQPQILVCFLIVLSLERLRSGAPISAGAALALAAAIKVFPALFVIFFLASRQFRASASFFVFGAVLGLTSIALTGWPLHAEFLQAAGSVSRTGLVVYVNYNIHGFLAQMHGIDALTQIISTQPAAEGGPIPHWHILAKDPMWNALTAIAPLAASAGLFVAFRRMDADSRFRVLWPGALMLLPLISPISWSYYFISGVVFAPTLLENGKTRRGVIVLLTFTVLTSVKLAPFYSGFEFVPELGQIVGCIAVLVLGLAYMLNNYPKNVV